jgi:hypothetical protein
MTLEYEPLTPGQKIMARLVEAKTAHGQKMTQDQGAAIIDGMIKELGLRKTRTRVNGRDQLFDGLCVACGIDPSEVTRPHGATIGTALADIAAVSPDLTPEEFGLRANKYKRLHPDWELTPSALATHWGELGTGDIGQTMASKCSAEPEGWQLALTASLLAAEWTQESIGVMLAGGWKGLSITHRINLARKLVKIQPEQKPARSFSEPTNSEDL